MCIRDSGSVGDAVSRARHHHSDQLAIGLDIIYYENRVHGILLGRCDERRSAGIRKRSRSLTITGLASTASNPAARRSGGWLPRASSTATIATSDSARSARIAWA